MLCIFPKSDFNKHDGFIIFHDQVNLTKAAGKVSLQKSETLLEQKKFRGFFPPGPGQASRL